MTIDLADVGMMVMTAREELAAQLQARFFMERPSNTRLVLACMSKQKEMETWLTPSQCELAKTLYIGMIKEASNIAAVAPH